MCPSHKTEDRADGDHIGQHSDKGDLERAEEGEEHEAQNQYYQP